MSSEQGPGIVNCSRDDDVYRPLEYEVCPDIGAVRLVISGVESWAGPDEMQLLAAQLLVASAIAQEMFDNAQAN